VVKKVEKKKAIAKSIVTFEVKIYEKETDLDLLAKKILETIKIDGLTWNNQPKKLDVAFGIQKLQMGCVIEDDKVLTDDIFEPIEQWEDVQSVDMVGMQKL
jgi:elongation factor 1-beta